MGAAVNLSASHYSLGKLARQAGLTLVELMVSIAIALTVMSGVVQVLVVSKANFVTERELSALQENARFALKFLGDEIRLAGFSGCSADAPSLSVANSIVDSTTTWYLLNLGMTGYEYAGGIINYPTEFRTDVAVDTDALVIRRAEDTGLRVSATYAAAGGIVPLNKAHAFQPGQPMVLASADCTQIGIFQSSGPINGSNTATTIEHDTGGGVTQPGNCVLQLGAEFTCAASGAAVDLDYPRGSRVMQLRSEAYYVGASEADATVPALFRERMLLNTTTSDLYTAAEELVQGIENMQILYGLDNSGSNGIADIYVQADNVLVNTTANWQKVVTVRLILRMRSVNPVYNENVDYPVFEGVTGTNGSDRFMRQTVSTTIQIRNG